MTQAAHSPKATSRSSTNGVGTPELIDGLNKTLADAIVLYHKFRHFHWDVRGEQFFELHAKFETLYTEWGEFGDEVAERVIAIGGQPVPTLGEALAKATISEDPRMLPAQEMVRIVVSDLVAHRDQMREVIDLAEPTNDRTTVNLLDEMHDAIEKHVWMLRAYLD
ncbi:MAG: Dps family protein [Planctomycetota bacterium]